MTISRKRSRRSKMEMNLDILRAIQMGEKKPTRIMGRSNMTWSKLQRGLEFLLDSGYIIEIPVEDLPRKRVDKRSKQIYQLTEKGESILRYFRNELKPVKNLITTI
ncbi:hypothetical protein GF326_07830 [Candidatus Bathyarchaeota archaeon]|jgi:predicted transcriptional regulator|nr:hypothetical protein [Candidatus Bathyarchaeota archaeon]